MNLWHLNVYFGERMTSQLKLKTTSNKHIPTPAVHSESSKITIR